MTECSTKGCQTYLWERGLDFLRAGNCAACVARWVAEERKRHAAKIGRCSYTANGSSHSGLCFAFPHKDGLCYAHWHRQHCGLTAYL